MSKNVIKAKTPDTTSTATATAVNEKPPEQLSDEILTANEVASRLKIGRGALRAHMRAGLVPFIKLGPRKYHFIWPDVVEALRRQQRNHLQ